MSSKSRGNPWRKKRKDAEGEPVAYMRLNLLSMTIRLSRRIFIVVHRDKPLFYSLMAASFVAIPDLATLFDSRHAAQKSLDKLEVTLSAQAQIVNLYEYMSKSIGEDPVKSGEAADDFKDMGIIDPTDPTMPGGDSDA